MKNNILNLKLSKKIAGKHQPYVINTLAELLNEGFSIKQAIEFLMILLPIYKHLFHKILAKLEEGQSLESGLREVGYSLAVVAQVFYAQRQGRFVQGLRELGQQLDLENQQKGKFIKVLLYPSFLFIFLTLMLLAMRSFILPHIASFISPPLYESNFAVRLLIQFFAYLPQILTGLLALTLILFGWLDFYLLRQSSFKRFKILNRIYIIRKWTRYYASYKFTNQLAYFSRGGYSMLQTIQVLIDYPIDPFMSELAQAIQEQMLEGQELTSIVENLDLFTSELPLIIYQGQLTSQFAQKCHLYSQKIYQQLIDDIELKMSFVQPILFIFIALLVVAMYMLMMLPMLTMEGI